MEVGRASAVCRASSERDGTGREVRADLWKRALLLVILSALPKCSSTEPTWTKPGASTADLRRDLVDCEREGTGLPPFHFWALNETYETARERIGRVKNECMAARGWRQVAKAQSQ